MPTQPTIFWHGTRSEIHTSDRRYLDPECAGRMVTENGVSKIMYAKDAGDPEKPHVFLSDSKLKAELFALQTDAKQHTCGCYDSDRFPVAIYQTKPEFSGHGYLYTISQDGYAPFRLTTHGKYYSEQKISVSEENCRHITAKDLFERPDPLRVYYFTDKTDIGQFSRDFGVAAVKGVEARQAFLETRIRSGELCRYDPYAPDRYNILTRTTPDTTHNVQTIPGRGVCKPRAAGQALTPNG